MQSNVQDNFLDLCKTPNFAILRLLGTFTGASYSSSVLSWKNCVCFPKGILLIKLKYFLELCGYATEEWANFDPLLYQAGKALAYGIIKDLDELSQLTGLKTANLLRKFAEAPIDASIVTPDKIKDFLDSKAQEIGRVKNDWEKKIKQAQNVKTDTEIQSETKPSETDKAAQATISQNDMPTPMNSLPVEAQGVDRQEQNIEILAHLIKAASPLAREISSDKYTPADREKLRSLCGKYGIFDLKNCLAMLCGERARQQIQQQLQEEK